MSGGAGGVNVIIIFLFGPENYPGDIRVWTSKFNQLLMGGKPDMMLLPLAFWKYFRSKFGQVIKTLRPSRPETSRRRRITLDRKPALRVISILIHKLL